VTICHAMSRIRPIIRWPTANTKVNSCRSGSTRRSVRSSGAPWAPGRLTGKIRRGLSVPEGSRRGLRPEDGPFVEDEHLFTIIEAIDEIARATWQSVQQVALNCLLR